MSARHATRSGGLPEPQSATFVMDAPATHALVLPLRPIRAITSLSLRWGANGDPDAFVADDELVEFDDWYSPADPIDGTNRAGLIYRRNASIWACEYRYPFGSLAPRVDPNRGAIKIVGSFGEASVPDDVRAACVSAVTLLMNRRTEGAPYASESWNGRTQSLAGPFTAEAAVNSPEILGFLRPYLTTKFG